MTTIKFWHYHNGSSVLIKLVAGQSLHHYSACRTDEGWSSEANEWEFDGTTVTSHWATDGVDCDGRMSRSGTSFFLIGDERSGYHDQDENITFPSWQEGEYSQRDYSAEAANY